MGRFFCKYLLTVIILALLGQSVTSPAYAQGPDCLSDALIYSLSDWTLQGGTWIYGDGIETLSMPGNSSLKYMTITKPVSDLEIASIEFIFDRGVSGDIVVEFDGSTVAYGSVSGAAVRYTFSPHKRVFSQILYEITMANYHHLVAVEICSNIATPIPTVTPTGTPTWTRTPTSTPTGTLTPTATNTPTTTRTPGPTPTRTPTPTANPSLWNTPTQTPSPTPPTGTPSATPLPQVTLPRPDFGFPTSIPAVSFPVVPSVPTLAIVTPPIPLAAAIISTPNFPSNTITSTMTNTLVITAVGDMLITSRGWISSVVSYTNYLSDTVANLTPTGTFTIAVAPAWYAPALPRPLANVGWTIEGLSGGIDTGTHYSLSTWAWFAGYIAAMPFQLVKSLYQLVQFLGPLGLFLTWLLVMTLPVTFFRLIIFVKNFFISLLNFVIKVVDLILSLIRTLADLFIPW